MKNSDIFWQTYLNIEKEILQLSKYIFFTDEKWKNEHGKRVSQPCTQLETFSPYIADLLVQCCIQIESLSKELYFDNGGEKQRGETKILFDRDCLSLINTKWSTDNKCVMVVAPSFNITNNSNRMLYPLKNAYKSKTLWEKAYQAVKHDRYNSLYKATVKSLLHASAALYLLNVYYSNNSWKTSYQNIPNFDYSMGSTIFSIKPPEAKLLWETNKPIPSESPYVVRYIDAAYAEIEKIQCAEEQSLRNYLRSQPELKEKNFLAKIKNYMGNNIFDLCRLLCQYRINKKIQSSLPFEKRKELLLDSNEWNSNQHQKNNHLSPDKITEKNIQNEIDAVGISMAISLTMDFKKCEWIDIAFNQSVCNVYIP